MKIFKVKIDNDPGGWKSGEDHSELVLAETQEEAIEKVRNGWGNSFGWLDNDVSMKREYYRIYGNNEDSKPHISVGSEISAIEIKFKGFEIYVTTLREQKLKRILKEDEPK